MGLLDFFGREAGQRRRAALDEFGRSAEQYVPPELRQIVGLLSDMTPNRANERAAMASDRLFQPDRTVGQRVGDFGEMASEIAGVAAPVAVAGRVGMPAAEALQEALMGFSAGSQQAGRAVVDRLNQPGPVPTMYSKPLLGVASDVADRGNTVLNMLKVGRGSDVTDEMLDMGDSVKNTQLNQYLFENYDLPMDEASRMARADERGMIDGLHGTMPSIYQNAGNPDIKGFEIERSTRGQSGKGIYFAPLDNHELANTFAGGRTISDADLELLDPNSPTIKGVVYPVKVKADNQANYQQMRQAQYDYEAKQRAEGKSAGYGGLSDSVFDTLKPQGFSGVSQKNEFTTFYPENIRSRFARFDPRLAHLRNLSAGVGGLGLLSSMMPPEEQY
tara:strand:- start:46 stop:1212 length:1167 start_codon:yes stop_codon:yes gene_type:complete